MNNEIKPKIEKKERKEDETENRDCYLQICMRPSTCFLLLECWFLSSKMVILMMMIDMKQTMIQTHMHTFRLPVHSSYVHHTISVFELHPLAPLSLHVSLSVFLSLSHEPQTAAYISVIQIQMEKSHYGVHIENHACFKATFRL